MRVNNPGNPHGPGRGRGQHYIRPANPDHPDKHGPHYNIQNAPQPHQFNRPHAGRPNWNPHGYVMPPHHNFPPHLHILNPPHSAMYRPTGQLGEISISADIEINEAYYKTKITQVFKNNQKQPIELKIAVLKQTNNLFDSFEAKIGETTVHSKVIEKEKAKEKYTDSIAEGNAAIYVEQDENQSKFIVCLGNIPSGETVNFVSNFIGNIQMEKGKFVYELIRNFPIFMNQNKDPVFKMSEILVNIKIKTSSEMEECQIDQIPNEVVEIKENKFTGEDKKEYIFNLKFKQIPTIQKTTILKGGKMGLNEYFPSRKIRFSLKNKDTPTLIFKQNNPKTNESVLLLKSDLSKYLKEKDPLSASPSIFIFLIDQSGSMAGSKMKMVREALKLFLCSLPNGSKYQLIGFGYNFQMYNQTTVDFNSENVKQSLDTVSYLEANKGGTNIYQPLSAIYSRKYSSENLPIHVIILTDGAVNNRALTLNLIENNSQNFTVHSIGIGNDFDKELIENAGILGKGGFDFVQQIENLNKVIINQVKNCVEPYDNNFEVGINTSNEILSSKLPNTLGTNESLNVFKIYSNEAKPEEIKVKFNIVHEKEKQQKIEENLKAKDILIELPQGEELTKIAINKMLSETENPSIIGKELEISKKYQILSDFTSLFAEVELKEEMKEEMKEIKNDTYIVKERPMSGFHGGHGHYFGVGAPRPMVRRALGGRGRGVGA
ncbi:MAG: VIT and VWA domain-containing protein, partial [archaeon]|nr:VIT and VWA domain-containing protein [archaeon]